MKVWGKKEPGLIDFALSSLPPATAESQIMAIDTRLQNDHGDGDLGVTYGSPIPGGRTRKDGVQVKWKVTRPVFSESINTPDETMFPNGRIDAPFFCHDVTSRNVRVPFDDEEKTTHPCGATSVAMVEILVPKYKIDPYVKLYSHILGSSPAVIQNDCDRQELAFEVGLPVAKVDPLQSVVCVRPARDGRDIDWLSERGIGISGLQLSVQGRENHGHERLGSEGIASTISLRW